MREQGRELLTKEEILSIMETASKLRAVLIKRGLARPEHLRVNQSLAGIIHVSFTISREDAEEKLKRM